MKRIRVTHCSNAARCNVRISNDAFVWLADAAGEFQITAGAVC